MRVCRFSLALLFCSVLLLASCAPDAAAPAKNAAGKSSVIVLTEKNFEEEVLKSAKPVLVDFWAEWCMPCRRIAPTVDALAADLDGRAVVGKMNVDENPNIPTSRFQVRGIPTLVVLKNGELVDTIVGLAPKEDIKKLLDRHLA